MSAKSQIFADADAENVDPATLGLSTKRKRTVEDDDALTASSKPTKTSRMALSSRGMNATPSNSLRIPPSTPKSAPILKPAGRSPQAKSCKTSSRWSSIAKPRVRPSGKHGVSRPFSLATALSQRNATKPQPKAPDSWFFDIHVDSAQEEMTNLMQHSTGVLDISDDEGKASAADSRGKENVPPPELGIGLPRSRQAVQSTAAHKASKMEEDRSPLVELNAADYYAEGCNAFSYAFVYDDENDVSESKKAAATPAPPRKDTFTPHLVTASITAVLESIAPKPVEEKTNASADKKKDAQAVVDEQTRSST